MFLRQRPAVPESVVLPPVWRRYGLHGCTIGLVLAGIVCARAARDSASGDDQDRYHDRSFMVARVVDGDTLDIEAPDGGKATTRIRLWGVDSPETRRGNQPAMHFGPEAKAFAERTLGGKRVHVVLSPRRTRGKYGRLLAYVFMERGGRMFNEMLLEQGFAYADLRFQHHNYDRFKSIEKQARRDGAGLWASVEPGTMPEWKQRFERSSGDRSD